MKFTKISGLPIVSAIALAATLSTAAHAQSAPTDAECAEMMTEMGLDGVTGPGGSEGEGTDTGGGADTDGGAGTEGGDGSGSGAGPVTGSGPGEPPVDPGEGDGNPEPVVTPTPTPTPPPSTGGNNLSAQQYNRNPSIGNMRVTTGNSANSSNSGGVVRYYRARTDDSYPAQNLGERKSYSAPTSGTIRTLGGQRVQIKNSTVNVANLRAPIVNIIDEIHITAATLGYPKPIITSGNDSQHSAGSAHGSNNAIDLRCNSANGMNSTTCRKWVVTLQYALGDDYDVIYEDYGNGNSHVHIAYRPGYRRSLGL
tara:strand:- start:491 stop:1423 length:933 start_codon:yes stop_codon:yes gene_type:complete